MNNDKKILSDPDHIETRENDGYDSPDSGIFDMRRDFRKLGDPKPKDDKLENDEELAGDPLGAETHLRHEPEQEDAP